MNIRALYESVPERVARARKKFGQPLTLAEKILVAHAADFDAQQWERGKANLRLRVDRVSMQDVTGQMALLQFMHSGKKRVAVPSTLHCDHLIRAESGAPEDMRTTRSTTSSARRRRSTGSASGSPAPASSTRSSSRITPFPAGS
jgi:aconitase A